MHLVFSADWLWFSLQSCRCISCSFFQHPLSDHQWTGTSGRNISYSKAGSTCCNGFHSWCAIRQQCIWWDAICGLG